MIKLLWLSYIDFIKTHSVELRKRLDSEVYKNSEKDQELEDLHYGIVSNWEGWVIHEWYDAIVEDLKWEVEANADEENP